MQSHCLVLLVGDKNVNDVKDVPKITKILFHWPEKFLVTNFLETH
jgi:hypothetical protein